jgi:hypothetical protein
VGAETAKDDEWKRKMSKWTEYYDYDHHQVGQISCYQFDAI